VKIMSRPSDTIWSHNIMQSLVKLPWLNCLRSLRPHPVSHL